MKLQFHNKQKKLFLTLTSKFNEQSKVDIVLSPELYWCRIFEIPVKKTKKAKKALPILFEEILPHNDFEYTCYKISDNLFISFAFNNSEIVKAIINSGLNLSQVKNIYLAQGQMQEYKSFKIEDNYYQYFKKLLVKLPYKLDGDYKEISSELKIESKKYKINTQLYSDLINKKYLETVYLLIFMLCFLSVFKYFQYDKQIENNEKYISEVKSQYDLPQSNIRFKSIKDNLKFKYESSENLKEKLEYLISFSNISESINIKSIDLSKNKILISYENIDDYILEEYLKEKIKKFTMKTNNNQIQIEVKL